MKVQLNTVLLVVAILLLGYIALLKPQPGRFAKLRIPGRSHLFVDTSTGRLCDPRTPSAEAIKLAEVKVDKLRTRGLDIFDEFALQRAIEDLYNLLHPSKRYPLCSEL